MHREWPLVLRLSIGLGLTVCGDVTGETSAGEPGATNPSGNATGPIPSAQADAQTIDSRLNTLSRGSTGPNTITTTSTTAVSNPQSVKSCDLVLGAAQLPDLQLAQVSLGERSLLDDTIVFFGSELQDPPSHKKNSMPFMLAGRGGGLQSGRYLEYAGASHNDLLVSLLNLFGDPRSSFGANQYCAGPLPGLV